MCQYVSDSDDLEGMYAYIFRFLVKREINDVFFRELVNTRLTKKLMAVFAPTESLPTPATLRPINNTFVFSFCFFVLTSTLENMLSLQQIRVEKGVKRLYYD